MGGDINSVGTCKDSEDDPRRSAREGGDMESRVIDGRSGLSDSGLKLCSVDEGRSSDTKSDVPEEVDGR